MARPKTRLQLETLEARVVLTTAVISEFLASNDDGLNDDDGQNSDWIELHNPTDQPVNLDGWYLTDDPDNKELWRFPAVTLAGGAYMVVFASDNDRRDPLNPLHTNFRLSAGGDYLALVESDGETVAHEYSPTYPQQYADVSYGPQQSAVTSDFVGAGGDASVLLPTSAGMDVPVSEWTAPGYDDSSWTAMNSGIGFDGGGELNDLIDANGDVSSLQNNGTSAYVRSEFQIDGEVPDLNQLFFDINYDDGFVAYLNGTEVASRNAPATRAWDSAATQEHGGVLDSLNADDFADGDVRNMFRLNGGSASWAGNRMRITSNAGSQAGAVWTVDPINFGTEYSFSAHFSFDIHTPGGSGDGDGLGADGMVFALQNQRNDIVGGGGGALGIDGVGLPFLGVEFDTWESGSFDPDNSMPTHVGITTASGSVARVPVARFNGGSQGQNIRYVWVEYDGQANLMEVYFSTTNAKPVNPILSATVDASTLFAGVTELYGGFTAGTGGAVNFHDVLNLEITTGAGEKGLVSERFDISQHQDLLVSGTNVLAVHGMNVTAADDDLLVAPRLTGVSLPTTQLDNPKYFSTPTPGAVNGEGTEAPAERISFSDAGGNSIPSGTFTQSFPLRMTADSPTATIRYTTDGSIPDESSTEYTGPFTVSNTSRIRARAFEEGRVPGPVVSANYIRLDPSLTNFQNKGQPFQSNLPLVILESYGDSRINSEATQMVPSGAAFIPVDPNTGMATITDEPEYAGRVGARVRGQTSQGFPKKQYAVEVWDEGNSDTGLIPASQADDLDVSIFGLPAESDWVLNGPYSDTSQLNNYMTFLLSNKMGLYAPRAVQVEVFVNSNGGSVSYPTDYVGTYILVEKIKVSEDRVDIHQLSSADNAEPEITGGYIWKKDKPGAGDVPWTSSEGQQLRHHDPDDRSITPQQTAWLTDHVNEFESVLYGPTFNDPDEGYAKYIDVDSWIDTWILVEMTKNIDGFRLSTYYYKDIGEKIKQGPAWDYNLAFGNANYLQGGMPNTWYHTQLNDTDYPYWRRLFEDPNFVQRLQDRWAELRQTVFSDAELTAEIDTAVNSLTNGNPNPAVFTHNDPISRNFTRWNGTGGALGVYTWPNCYLQSTDTGHCASNAPRWYPRNYNDYISNFRWFVDQRVHWMDSTYLTAPTITVDGDTATISGSGDIYYTIDTLDPRKPELPPELISQVTLVQDRVPGRAFVPTDGSLGLSWTQPGFDDGAWLSGNTGIGYDENPDYLPHIGISVDSQMHDLYTSAYLRVPFTVTEDTSSFNFMTLDMKYDDGFVAYLNGTEIARSNNIPGGLSWSSQATGIHDDSAAISFVGFDVTQYMNLLDTGENVLAIHGLNESLTSSDFLISPRLIAGEIDTGGGEGGVESRTAVLYTGPITVTENTQITARAYDTNHPIFIDTAHGNLAENTQWSAPAVATVVVTPVTGETLAITELNYHPLDPTQEEMDSLGLTADMLDDDDFEFIELRNIGDQTVNLVNVEFSDGIEFSFPSLRLAPNEYVLVVENLAAFEARYGTGHNIAGQYTGNLNNAGERLTLVNSSGEVIVDFEYSDGGAWPGRADGGGSSLELIDTAGDYDSGNNWRSSIEYQGSPGAAGTGVRSGIVINEVLSHTDPPSVDSIELYNTTDQMMDIGGWFLSDSRDQLDKYQIQAGTMIAPGGYMTFNESHFNPTPGTGTSFALNSAHGDDVWLTEGDASGKILRFADDVEFGAQANGESWGRVPNGTGVMYPLSTTTLGGDNSGPRIGPIVISEVQYNPIGAGQTDDDYEFVEIHNPTQSAVDLTGWRIRGGVDYDFDAGEMLGPSETLVILRFEPNNGDNSDRLDDFRSFYGIDESVRLVGGFSGQLSNDGESVRLERPDQPPLEEPEFTPHLLEDQIVYNDAAPWTRAADGEGASLGREMDFEWGLDAGSWYAGTPSPGSVPPSTQVAFLQVNGEIPDPADLPSGSQPTSWLEQRSDIRTIVINFNQDVTVTAADLTLTNLGVNAPVDDDVEFVLTDDHVANNGGVVTLNFDAMELPEGVYQLTISGGVMDQLGQSLDGDGDGVAGDDYSLTGNTTNAFYRLTGEWRRDGGVSIFDYGTFAYWFGRQTAPHGVAGGVGAPDYVNLNGDTGISIFDFNAFVANYGKGVVSPVGLASASLDAAAFVQVDRSEEAITERDEAEADEQAVDRADTSPWNQNVARRWNQVEVEPIAPERDAIDSDLLDELAADLESVWRGGR